MTNITIALAGNPNSGKTTLFNALTGSNQYVGNWPGVTVEKKDGFLKDDKSVVVQDLPGIYSLSPYSLEEKVTRKYLVEERPDVILNVVDGTNVERNLYLSTQLAELGIPMVLAVNMTDILRKRGDVIDCVRLAKALGCEVVGISAQRGEGVAEAAAAAVRLARAAKGGAAPCVFTGSVARTLAYIEETIRDSVPKAARRWLAVKIFERDNDAVAPYSIPAATRASIEERIRACEKELDDDAESIVTNQRYAFIQALTGQAVAKKASGKTLTISDRIDKVVTHRFWALPIFVLSLCAMWFLAVAENGPGTLLTDWANDGFLGSDGWTLPFTSIHVPGVADLLSRALAQVGVSDVVASLVNDGAWGGVATVLGFVPVIAIVFLFLSFLEDCGYMARVAFIMDRLFRKFGLSGKSFIPMIVGKGCGVPAVMAARTIENERDHRMTVLLATFIPCSAKTVIIALFMSLFFREQWYVAPLMDVLGIAIVVLGGIALKKSRAFAGEAAPFVMELPAYHWPTARGILLHVWQRVKAYMIKAGVIIFPACVFLWFVMHFDWSLNLLADEEIERSILHDLGTCIAWFFAPLGFGSWQGAAATVSAEIAKEQATATLALVAGGEEGIVALFGQMSAFPRLAAFSFLVFNLFVPPCMVAIATTFREMGSAKWGWFALAFQLLVGYAIALSAYQFGTWIAGGAFGVWTAVTAAVDVAVLWAILRPTRKEAAK